jgi:hypothetical protein
MPHVIEAERVTAQQILCVYPIHLLAFRRLDPYVSYRDGSKWGFAAIVGLALHPLFKGGVPAGGRDATISAMAGCRLTTTDALRRLAASVSPTSAVVFAPLRLAGAARVWHLGVLPRRWILVESRRARQWPGHAVVAGRVAHGHGRSRMQTWARHTRSRAASVVPTVRRVHAQAWTPWPRRRG